MHPEEIQAQDTVIDPKAEAREEADRILKYHIWSAMGVGLVPIPLVDLVALTGIQLNMLRRLAKAYKIPFFKDTVKSILSSLAGSTLPVAVAPGLAASVAKIIPGLGQTVGVVAMPIVAGASTYAVGKVFIQHFASGGTFLTFDPKKVKAYYVEMFQEGKQVVTTMKKENPETKTKSETDTPDKQEDKSTSKSRS